MQDHWHAVRPTNHADVKPLSAVYRSTEIRQCFPRTAGQHSQTRQIQLITSLLLSLRPQECASCTCAAWANWLRRCCRSVDWWRAAAASSCSLGMPTSRPFTSLLIRCTSAAAASLLILASCRACTAHWYLVDLTWLSQTVGWAACLVANLARLLLDMS